MAKAVACDTSSQSDYQSSNVPCCWRSILCDSLAHSNSIVMYDNKHSIAKRAKLGKSNQMYPQAPYGDVVLF